MYHPGTGRFLSEDPLGFEAGDSNLYRYVQNSPPNYTDPTGQRGIPVLVPEAPPAPLPVAPAQPVPTPRIPGLGVLGGAAVILLQDLLFPRPLGFGEDEFLEQLRCNELDPPWKERQNWPHRCQLQDEADQPFLNRRLCIYRCRDVSGDTVHAYTTLGSSCPKWMDWLPPSRIIDPTDPPPGIFYE